MKIYLAGKWEERYKIKEYMGRLQKQGHTITCDWFHHDTEFLDNVGKTQVAREDFAGATTCNILIFIAETVGLKYTGSLVEMGGALAMNRQVAVVGHGIDHCLFIHLPQVSLFETFEQVEKWLEFMGGDNGRVHTRSLDRTRSKVLEKR